MIVARLLGGLGNQMFQYALGRALSARHATELKLDTAAYAAYRMRTYGLRHFNIVAGELSPGERSKLGLSEEGGTRVRRFISRLFRPRSILMVDERSFEFDATVLEAPAPCYLRGYWQSPKYFAAIEPNIRQELTLREPPDRENQEAAGAIADCVSVAVHVRRGDYVESATTSRFHGTCSPGYYLAAEERLLQQLRDLRLFVFSDDPDWAERNLQFVSPVTYFRHNGPERDYEDLRLMSLCRHHIIANSTFSWWGAWLCRNPDKIVIAPQNWFREATHSTRDLIPDNWIRM
jgi:hypothetical protein